MAPTAKKPSMVFMNRVCDVVDSETSPTSASAPILKTLMPRPESASSITNAPKRSLTANTSDAAPYKARPTMTVGLRPSRSARKPSSNAPAAMPAIVAYWNALAAVMLSENSAMTAGITLPTASVVIAKVKNIKQTSARIIRPS